VMYPYQPSQPPPWTGEESRLPPRPRGGLGWGLCLIPIAEPEFTKVRMNENPLLKVPPASRGNRTRARFPSRSGGNLQEGGTIDEL
jgi:hypothetical protein